MRKTFLALVVVAGLATAGCIFAPQGGSNKAEEADCSTACATACSATAEAKKSCGDDCSKPCCADN
ncbi:MAG: hypothetical protein AAEJ04_08550 [Planctomycetota bacterium]